MSLMFSSLRLREASFVAIRALTAAAAVWTASLLWEPARAEDQFEPVGGGWQAYINERYGTSLEFPADIFTANAPPSNGDGRSFSAEDATLEVYSWENTEGETAASLEERLVGSDGYTDVTYSPSGRSWLVLSGFRGDNIFYEKYFFQNGVISGFGMEFPREEKPFYEAIVERIEDSFSAGGI